MKLSGVPQSVCKIAEELHHLGHSLYDERRARTLVCSIDLFFGEGLITRKSLVPSSECYTMRQLPVGILSMSFYA